MAGDILRRQLAPISPEAWAMIDEEATRTLKGHLSARKVVDIKGPFGWTKDAISLGRLALENAKDDHSVKWAMRKVQPLLELRAHFTLSQLELDDVTRGEEAPDLDPVEKAACQTAIFEERAIYRGLAEAGIEGLIPSSAHKPVSLPTDAEGFDDAVASAVEAMQIQGVNGPYHLVLGTKPYQALSRGILPGGVDLSLAVDKKIRGSVLWSPGIDGGVLITGRGGDIELTIGQDISIGFEKAADGNIDLYFAESFTMRVLEPRATLALTLT